MRSALPKVLHTAAGRPLLDRVLGTAREVLAETKGTRLVVVTGPGDGDPVAVHLRSAGPDVAVVPQPSPRGTGDALQAAMAGVGEASRIVVLPGDAPLVTPASVRRLLAELNAGPDVPAAFLSAVVPDPSGYGRVLRDAHGVVVAVVEERDASEREREIREVNGGVYAFDRAFLEAALPRLEPANAADELYLTDLLAMAVESGRPARVVVAALPGEISRRELAGGSRPGRGGPSGAGGRRRDGGGRHAPPARDDHPRRYGDDCKGRGPGAVRHASRRNSVGEGTPDRAGVRDPRHDARTERHPDALLRHGEGPRRRRRHRRPLRPLARGDRSRPRRPHRELRRDEKGPVLRRGAKANHLTYLGDVEVGERTNVGAGVITCNYDGFAKHRTTIGKDVFVGSDVQLVAPVSVGDGAVIGAGTTVTEDVPADALATSRTPQRTTDGGGAALPRAEAREEEKVKGTKN